MVSLCSQPLSGQYIAPIQSSMQSLSLTHQSTQSQPTYSQPILGQLMQDQHLGKITYGNLCGQPFQGQPTLMYTSQSMVMPNQSPVYTPQNSQGMYLPTHPNTGHQG